jgi:ABC-type oligopeptide transport system ATPase subunit
MKGEPLTVEGTILRTRNLTKVFSERGLFSSRRQLCALDHVDIDIFPGRTLALVGETGSGKSTLARCLARFEEPTSGEIRFQGLDFCVLRGIELRTARRQVQLIFQEAMSALNPGFSALEMISEPLVLLRTLSKLEISNRAFALLDVVDLPRASAHRRVHEFSGGQKQRLALARALAANPKVIIFDEALSGLDLSAQAQMMKLLLELQGTHNLAYLFITHDLALAGAIADEIAVMKNGSIIESSEASQLFKHPQNPYSKSLVAQLKKNELASCVEEAAVT